MIALGIKHPEQFVGHHRRPPDSERTKAPARLVHRPVKRFLPFTALLVAEQRQLHRCVHADKVGAPHTEATLPICSAADLPPVFAYSEC
jgi:hypothetical protein